MAGTWGEQNGSGHKPHGFYGGAFPQSLQKSKAVRGLSPKACVASEGRDVKRLSVCVLRMRFFERRVGGEKSDGRL